MVKKVLLSLACVAGITIVFGPMPCTGGPPKGVKLSVRNSAGESGGPFLPYEPYSISVEFPGGSDFSATFQKYGSFKLSKSTRVDGKLISKHTAEKMNFSYSTSGYRGLKSKKKVAISIKQGFGETILVPPRVGKHRLDLVLETYRVGKKWKFPPVAIEIAIPRQDIASYRVFLRSKIPAFLEHPYGMRTSVMKSQPQLAYNHLKAFAKKFPKSCLTEIIGLRCYDSWNKDVYSTNLHFLKEDRYQLAEVVSIIDPKEIYQRSEAQLRSEYVSSSNAESTKAWVKHSKETSAKWVDLLNYFAKRKK